MTAAAPVGYLDMAVKAVELIGIDPMFRVFPLFGIDPETRSCACGNTDPKHKAGKHPWLRGSFQATATTDRAKALRLFDRTHPMNIAIATGQGLVVIDVDVDPGKGVDGFAALVAAGIDLDATPTRTARTGRGGKHYFFRCHEDVAGGVDKLVRGVDVKAYGGYVVAPPSLHASGHRYEWLDDLPIAELPGELLAVLGRSKQKALRPAAAVAFKGAARARAIETFAKVLLARGLEGVETLAALENEARCAPPLATGELAAALSPVAQVRPGAVRLLPRVTEGKRHPALVSVAGSLARIGLSVPVVARLLLAENALRCSPPHDDAKVEGIALAVCGRYAPSEPYYEGLETPEEGVEDSDWQERLVRRPDKDGVTGAVLPTLLNARIILAHDPLWRGVLGFDELAGERAFRLEPPWLPEDREPSAKLPRSWTDVDDARVTMWLDAQHGLRVASPIATAAAAVVAAGKPFDAVKEYLERLEWDRVPRLSTWLEAYARAGGPEIIRRGVGRMWLISAVARTFEPGCQADYMLVLEGAQGARKSSLVKALVPRSTLYSDTPLDLGAKDALQGLRGRWIVEMAELKAVRGAHSVEAVKAFLSSRRDDYRASYGRAVVSHERRCVFAGTVNPTAGIGYHTDATGARRFWPVPCGDTDVESLERDRDQLWAEAVAAYRAGELWHPERGGELEAALVEAQNERTEGDANDVQVLGWLASADGQSTIARQGFVSIVDVATKGLGTPRDRITRAVQTQVGVAMIRLGWRADRPMLQGVRVTIYRPPPTPA